MQSIRSKFFPVMVAYQWIAAFTIILIVPLLWLLFYNTYVTVAEFIVNMFPKSFEDKTGIALQFMVTVWHYLPVIIIVATLIWIIMETLKERKREAYPYE